MVVGVYKLVSVGLETLQALAWSLVAVVFIQHAVLSSPLNHPFVTNQLTNDCFIVKTILTLGCRSLSRVMATT